MTKLEQAARQAEMVCIGVLLDVTSKEKAQEAITALREALAKQAEQEPVACISSLTEQCAALVWERDELQKKLWQYEKQGCACQLYYTKDLTDEEICEIGKATHSVEGERYLPVTFARAVIAKFKEKNK